MESFVPDDLSPFQAVFIGATGAFACWLGFMPIRLAILSIGRTVRSAFEGEK